MSKLSFRARQVDYTKPLPIYLNHDLPDLQDFAAINRAVPQMPTGMEKDEEAEHHLQRALSALQAFGDKSSTDYSIPTPKVEIDNKMYDRIYNVECPKQKQYIRIQPFSNDYDYPDYDADYEDENWLTEMKKTLPDDFTDDLILYFETVMDKLEKATCYSTNLMSLEEAKMILIKDKNNNASGGDDSDLFNTTSANTVAKEKYQKELEAFLIAIYEYWKKKRTKWKHPLTPIVMTDKSGIVTAPNNPYLVFRRRIEKMQTRKNRKNEEQSYEKMLILKRDLCRAQHILKLIKKRENFKKEFLKLTLETFEKRYKLNDYDGVIADQIMCMLKPSAMPTLPHDTTNNSNNTKLSQNNNHTNNNNHSSNLSSIDKTIVNLINSNKLKTLGSPPHSSLKKVPHLENDFLVDSIYGTKQKQQQLSDKSRRHKKEKRIREDSTSSNNNISTLISNKANQKIIGNLIDLSNKSKLHAHLLANSNNLKNKPNHAHIHASLLNKSGSSQPGSPLLNRPANKLEMFKKTHKLINSMELEQMQFNRMVNLQRRRNNSVNSKQALAAGTGGVNSDLNNGSPMSSESGVDGRRVAGEAEAGVQKNAALLNVFNELRLYEEELRANQIENLDAVLSETKNRLSTSSDKDGYWYFKRKEGCKYLPQSGPIFKNDVLEEATFRPKPPLGSQQIPEASTSSLMEPPSTLSSSSSSPHVQALLNLSQKPKPPLRAKVKRTDRLRDLQQFYYGYVVTKRNRHLGLVRRRTGRNGRIILDRFNEDLTDSIGDFDRTKMRSKNSSDEQMLKFDFSKFKTYYPFECFDLNEATNNSELSSTNATNTTTPEFQLPTAGGATGSTGQPKKKKLKLKSFEPAASDTIATFEDDDHTETFYDHNLFDPLQLNDTHVNTTHCQFIDAATEAQLTTAAIDDDHLKQIVQEQITKQVARVPQSTITDLAAFTNPVTNYEYLGTDLDFDNLFEPDDSVTDAVVVDNSKNVIRVNANPGQLNYEYRPGHGQDCLSLASVKEALKNLKIIRTTIKQKPVNIESAEANNNNNNKKQKLEDNEVFSEGQCSRQVGIVVGPLKSESSGRSDAVLIPSPAGSCDDDGLSKGHEEDENKASNESLANITSTTLTPPSPSPEVKTDTSSTVMSTSKGSTPPPRTPLPAVNLSKITILSSTTQQHSNNTNSNNNSRFQALNKATTQFQFRPLSPSSNSNNKSNEAANKNSNSTSILIPNGTSYLVKNTNSPQVNNHSNANNNNQATSFYSSTSTSSSSSPSSSSLSTANTTPPTPSSVTVTSSSNNNGGVVVVVGGGSGGGASGGGGSGGGGVIPLSSVSQHTQPTSQHSSVTVNGLLSKKKDENSPFYPVYQNNNNTNIINTNEIQQQQNNSKLLQAIHFNQSNSLNLVASIQATSSSAPSSSSSSQSSTYSNNSVHNHLYHHHHHSLHQKPVNGQSQSSSNLSVVVQQVPTPVGDHATKTTKLI